MNSIKQYLVGVAVALVLLISAAAALLLYHVDRLAREQSEQQLLSTTRAMSLVVDGELARLESILRTLGTSESLTRGDWERFDGAARSVVAGPSVWVMLADRSGQQLVNTKLPRGTPLPRGGLPPSFWAKMDGGKPRVCNLSKGLVEPAILCVDFPIMRGGRATYVLSAVLRPDQLGGVVRRQPTRAGTYVTVVDRSGVVAWRNVGAERFIGKPATPDIREALLRSSEGTRRSYSLEGTPTVAAYHRSPISGWTFIVAVPRADMYAGTSQAAIIAGTIAALFLLLGAGVGLFAARRVTKAIQGLAASAQGIESGEIPSFRPSGLREIDETGRVLENALLARNVSQERYRRIFEQTSDLILTADLEQRITDCNPSAAQAVGLPREQAIGRAISEFVSPEDFGRTTEMLHRKLTKGGTTRYDVRVRNTAGDWLYWEINSGLTFDRDGRPLELHVVGRDVTERKRAEERQRLLLQELNASQAELRAVYDAVPVGIVLAEAPSGRITGGNAEAERIFGHPVLPSPDVASYREWIGFHADGRQVEGHEYPLSRALRGLEERPELEVLYRRGDGRDAWLRLIASPIRDEQGDITGAVVAALDIDKKRQTEGALKQLNERLELEVQQRTAERDRMWRLSTDLMLVATFEGIIEAVNPAWSRLLGWEEQELVGRSFMTLVHPDDVEATLAQMASLERGETTFRFTNRYQSSDGAHRWISWTAVPGDNLIHAVGRDITVERQAAAELEQAQEALRQSQKLEAMGQLTGGVAHDFNNLLSPIIGGLDLLQRRGFGDERARRTIAGALASAERAKTLVQRLLAFARRQPLQPTAVQVSRIIRDMAGLLASTLGPRIDLRIDVPEELPAARADANQLEMALLNLTVNARDAMPEGGILSITAASERVGPGSGDMSPGQYVRITVRDTGNGMDAETLARCIEPFFSTKGVGQGTGLGLSMVHGLAAQLSGALRIQSRPGAGTEIELWLPVTDAIEASQSRDEEIAIPLRAGVALVVDDEELVRSSTADMLNDLGYDTVEAASAEDALQVLGQQRVDLLVTDHLMPGMTGTELAQATRQRFPLLKVLIVSGYADAEGLDPSYTRLTKPFRQSELAAALRD